MQNSDHPFYHQKLYLQTHNPPPNFNPMEPFPRALPSYASAPPFSANPAAYAQNPPSYPSFAQPPDSLPTAPSYSLPQAPYRFPHGRSFVIPYHRRYDLPVPNHGHTPNPSPISPTAHIVSSTQHPQSNNSRYDSLYDNRDVSFGRSRPDLGSDYYGKRGEDGYANDSAYSNNDGVYAYRGNTEPYGARGTAPKSSTWSGFDDFGRPIGYSSSASGKEPPANSGLKLVRAVPKADMQQDAKSRVLKFRVKLLAESGGQSTMDVLCQVWLEASEIASANPFFPHIGLDGIRMLDPSTSRILRIYLLDTITRCEVIDSKTFAFWSKSSVDIEPRRIRLQSNSYTTNTILDTVTAAIVQYKEMSGRSQPSEHPKIAEQPTEKKKGFGDFMNILKPVNEEKDHWVPDEAVTKCTSCGTDFSAFVRKHHCRNCGDIFCDKCTQGRTALNADENAPVVRVCDRCLAEVSRRLNTAKEAATRPTVVQSHEDLAKKLQVTHAMECIIYAGTAEDMATTSCLLLPLSFRLMICQYSVEEMERSCKVSSGSRSNGSGKRLKEVACPTCTVHLQVQIPSSGSETIECGVCQHSFLVTSH